MKKKIDDRINRKLFKEALKYIPGGVNSPARSFKSVGRPPIFISRAKGSKIYSESGAKFIDYCLSWGAMILGHAHPGVTCRVASALKKGTSYGTVTRLETELAKLIVNAVPSIQKVRLTSSGTEAVMGAVRLARAYTGRSKVIKFEGAYHGHPDYLLVKSGSGGATLALPDSPGVPPDFTRHTIVLPYNNIKKAEEVTERYKNNIAAILVEPVMGNCGVILPKNGFLEALREMADNLKIVLIFDEVITGFRLSYGGAQTFFSVKPDLTCLGKIIGGGLPVGAFGGREEIMKNLVPSGNVYQAGTLSGNPITVTAGISTLKFLKDKKPYRSLNNKTSELCEGIREIARAHEIKLKIICIGSMFSLFFGLNGINDYRTARKQNLPMFKKFFNGLLDNGVYFSPSAFESNFLSISHTLKDINRTLEIIDSVFGGIK